jgi:hypothetical protein
MNWPDMPGDPVQRASCLMVEFVASVMVIDAAMTVAVVAG